MFFIISNLIIYIIVVKWRRMSIQDEECPWKNLNTLKKSQHLVRFEPKTSHT
mgnify:FL=1